MFHRLQELANLLEAGDDITAGAASVAGAAKAGWDRTRNKFNSKVSQAQADSKKAEADSKKAEDEAKKALSASTATALKKDLRAYVDGFFDKFPSFDQDGPDEEFLKKYQDRVSLKGAAAAFNGIAKNVDELRTAFNRAIVNATGVNKKKVAQYATIENTRETPENDDIQFVRGESRFFKQLFQIDTDFTISDAPFKQMLSDKINRTDVPKRNEAVEKLNRVFAYMSAQFREYADVISQAGAKLPQDVKEDESDAAKKAAERVADARQKRKDQEREADQKNAEAEKAAKKAVDAEEKIKDKAAKESEAAIKAAAADHKASTAESVQELRKDLDDYANTMIDAFPFDKVMTADEVRDKFPTREAALAAFKAYRDVGDRLEQLVAGFTRSIASTGKVRDEQIQRYKTQAARMMKGGNPAVPRQLIGFVKAEAKFFKRLIQIGDDLKLDSEEFKDRLTIKINQTDAARLPDATQALTLLFAYLSARYRENARVIADVGRSMDDENVTVKKTARDAAAASAAAEVEARAKSNGR